MINNVVLVGRLCAEPELKKTQSDLSVCSFRIANETGYGENKKTHFLPVVAWRGTAEFVCKYFTKGQMIGIIGQLTMRKWEDKDGKSHNAYEIVANEVQFAEPKKDREDERAFTDAEYEAAERDSAKPAKRRYDALVEPDGLPF